MSKVYLAGPMSNIPYFNFPAFIDAAGELRKQGHMVFNPAESDIETYGDFWKSCPNGTHEEAHKAGLAPTYREVLKVDLNWILDHAEVIAFLPGWDKSKGVAAEKALAECLNLEQIYL
jgi:hypothetical protein